MTDAPSRWRRAGVVAVLVVVAAGASCTDGRPGKDPSRTRGRDRPSSPEPSVTSLSPPASPTPEFTPPAEPAACPGEIDLDTARPPGGSEPEEPVDGVVSTEVAFTSTDGAEVPAVYAYPEGAEAPLPGVVLVHGGFGREPDAAEVEQLASLGFAVIGPEYRANDIGGLEVDDVAAGARFLALQPAVDPARVAVFGTSHGASIAGLAAARFPGLFAAVVWVSGPADWACIWTLNEGRGVARGLERSLGTTPVEDFEAYAERSPLYWAEHVRVPVLVIHSEHDGTVPPGQSQLYADALRDAGVEVEQYLAVGSGHRFLERAPLGGPDWTTILGFLDRTLDA